MRFGFLLALVACCLSSAWAQVPPTVADTAALGFTRWLLGAGPEQLRPPYRLYRFTMPWREAQLQATDTATSFAHKLVAIHHADTAAYTPEELVSYRRAWRQSGLPATFFSGADLAAMRQQYTHEARKSWPVLGPAITPASTGYYRRCFVVVTVPLFSLDGRRAAIWRLRSCRGHSDGAQLLVFERDAAGRWQPGPGHFPGWLE
jgi:hypothetical protein